MVDKITLDSETLATDYIKSDWDKTAYLGNPNLDAVTLALHALGAEVWSGRRRMHVIEALLDKKIPVTRASIEKYQPTKEEEHQWKADRDRFVSEVFSSFLNVGSISLASADALAYDPHKEPAVARRPAFDPSDKDPEAPKTHPAGGPRE